MAYIEEQLPLPPTPEMLPQPAVPVAQGEKKPSFGEWLGTPEAMAFASGLLKASGPSTTPISMGQAIGMGMEDMLKAKLQFGNQQLDKDKFGYQKTQDTKEFGLKEKKFGLDEKQFGLQEKYQGAHGRLYDAQVKDLERKQRDLTDFINELSGKKTDPLQAAVPSTLKPSTPMSPTGQTQPTPTQAAMPQIPQSGMLSGAIPTPMATQPTPQGQVGLLSNLSPEKKRMALLLYSSGHPEKIPELILGKPPEPFTLSEGQVHYDINNKPVAFGIPKNEDTNTMKELKSIKLVPGTPEWEKALTDRVNKANIQHQIKIPPGYTTVKDGDLSAGLVRIPGGPAEQVDSQDAGRIQMIRTAKKDLGKSRGDVEALLFNKKPDGTPDYNNPNRTNIFTANASGIPFVESIPHTEGRQLRSAMEQAIQAITRIETGAAMPASEIENTMTRYMPRTGDDAKTVLMKWNRMKDFVGDANKLMDPSRHFETERFKSDLSDERSLAEQLGKKKETKKVSGAQALSNDDLRKKLGLN